MPPFVAALLVAPSSSSSLGTPSTVGPSAYRAESVTLTSESAYERRKSIANGAQPYRTLRRNPPSFDLSLTNSASTSSSTSSQHPSLDSRLPPGSSLGGVGRVGRRGNVSSGSMGGLPSLDSLRPITPEHHQQPAQPRHTPHRPQQGYADMLARVLREGGIPVSNLRTLGQVQSHMSLSPPLPPTPTSPKSTETPLFQPSFSLAPPPSSQPLTRSTSSSSSSQTSQAFILLLPLNDQAPSTLATARLIRESGKTPSSICFDLEHEVGEKEWERTFVEALAVIEQVETMRASWGKEVLVVAYSADPDITPEAVQRCRDAGADAVLYPPFDESSATVHQLQQALSSHRSELSSFSFGSQSSARPPLRTRVSPPHPLSHLSSPPDTPPSPPETGSQSSSACTDSSSLFGSAGSLSRSAHGARFDPFPHAEAPTPTTTSDFLSHLTKDPSGPRRASVDTGGLALALERADEAGPSGWDDADEEDEAGETDTLFAEVLSEMHCQTRSAVESQMVASPDLSSSLSEARRAELIVHMSSWHFEPHKFSAQDVHHCSCILFEATLMIEGLWELDIPLSRIHRFLSSLQSIYHAPNPYHNAVHALDVTQASYSFLAATGVVPPFEYLLQMPARRPPSPWQRRLSSAGQGRRDERAKEVLRPQDVFAVMIAAIGHDVAHPGLSNIFMKNAKSPISEVYSDSSALENMHCCIVVTLLRKHGFDFLFPSPASSSWASLELTPRPRRRDSLPPTPPLSDASDVPPPLPPTTLDWTDFRSILSASILSTDMAMHFGWITRLVELGQRLAAEAEGEPLPGAPRSEHPDVVRNDRVMICQAIIKCADISNPTRPYEVSKHWSTVLLDEWTNQACLETGLDIPVSVIKNADAALQAKGQTGFINLFVYPLFSASAAVLPGLSVYVQYCTDNLATWTERLQTLTSAPPSPSVSIHPARNPMPSSPAPSDTTIIPLGPSSPYRSLFPLTLPSMLLSNDGRGSENASTSTRTSAGTDAHRRRAMQAAKSAAIGLPSRDRWKRDKRWRRRSADGSLTPVVA